MRYVALLRGINVGGKNVLPMSRLRSLLTDGGFENVQTYIQSGNVLIDAPRQSAKKLQGSIERMLKKAGYDVKSLVLTGVQLDGIIHTAPKLFAKDKKTHLCDVIFLIPPLTPATAIKRMTIREGIDTVEKGPRVLYSSRLKAKLTKSGLSKVAQTDAYQKMTIRNWNTTKKLAALLRKETV